MTITKIYHQVLHAAKVIFDRFQEDDCLYRAAALTYTTLLSIVPLMTVSFAIFSVFPAFETFKFRVQDFIFSHFVAASGGVVESYLQYFVAQSAKISMLGAVFLVATAVLMMFTMEQAFNAIWRVKIQRKFISAFMLYWAVLTLSPILIGISLGTGSYLLSLPLIANVVNNYYLYQLLLMLLPFVSSIVVFALIYITVPNCSVPLRYGIIGAIVAAVLFEIAKQLFAFYVLHFSTYTLLYGALATIPLFLLWLYFTWVIILFGAIISNILATGYLHRTSVKMDGFTHAYLWLGYFWQALQDGKELSLQELLNWDNNNFQVEPERQLELMAQAKLIQPTNPGYYVLSCDLSSFTLEDLVVALPWRLPTPDEISQWQNIWEKRLAEIVVDAEQKTQDEMAIPLARLYS